MYLKGFSHLGRDNNHSGDQGWLNWDSKDDSGMELWPTVHHTCFPENTSFKQSRRRQWHPTPVLLPGKSQGQRSVVGCSPWGREESDTTERIHFYFSLLCSGEGNGNPLQCSCLENPRDGGAWWAADCGITQSWTCLK